VFAKKKSKINKKEYERRVLNREMEGMSKGNLKLDER
jgi:hypothetical protein